MDPVKVFAEAIAVLRMRGVDAGYLEAGFEDPRINLIVGRWPPDPALPLNLAAVMATRTLFAETGRALEASGGQRELAGPLAEILLYLDQIEITSPEGSSPDEDTGSAEESINGRWPPD